MKTKPDQEMLMAYLYDELEPQQRADVEDYLEEHPEVKLELQQWKSVRSMLHRVEDKEVIPPSFIFPDEQTRGRGLWMNGFMKVSLGIAAGLALFMAVISIVGTRISWGRGELVIRVGQPQPEVAQPTEALTASHVQSMIDQSLVQNNETWKTELAANQARLDQSVKSALAVNSTRMDRLVQVAATASEAQVRQFATDLQDRNLAAMKDYMKLSSNEQKVYIENLLVDFSRYLQEQRNQDLKLFQARLTDIEKNTGQFQQETEQILTSIISSANPKTKFTSY
jgi:anti-sigma factor RsiW